MADRPLYGANAGASLLELPAVPSSIPTIRHEVDRLLRLFQLLPARAADVRLALTEACTNAVQHAYGDGVPSGQITVTFHVSSNILTLSVADTGRGVSGPSPQPGLGVGLPIIHALADHVTIEHHHPGTELRMTFEI